MTHYRANGSCLSCLAFSLWDYRQCPSNNISNRFGLAKCINYHLKFSRLKRFVDFTGQSKAAKNFSAKLKFIIDAKQGTKKYFRAGKKGNVYPSKIFGYTTLGPINYLTIIPTSPPTVTDRLVLLPCMTVDRRMGTKYAQGWLLWLIWAEQADTSSSLIELRGGTKTTWPEDDGTYLHAMCRGVSSNQSLLIAFFGSTPAAITRRTLSRLPESQALKSSFSSSARPRVDIVRQIGHVMQECGWGYIAITQACAQTISVTWRGWGCYPKWVDCLLNSMTLVPSETNMEQL